MKTMGNGRNASNTKGGVDSSALSNSRETPRWFIAKCVAPIEVEALGFSEQFHIEEVQKTPTGEESVK